MFKVNLVFVVGMLITIQQVVPAPIMDSLLMATLEDKPTAIVILTMKDRTSDLLNLISTLNIRNRDDRLKAVYESLRHHADATQANVLAYLRKESILFESMWITNQIIIRNANLSLVEQLASFPEIAGITEELIHNLDEPVDVVVYENLTKATTDEIQWGVIRIKADTVWADGNKGEGIVVATVDTGVRYTHEALRDNFREDYGWYDPGQKTIFPYDNNGLGTHTTGTIAGTTRGIGVAPGAKWIACKGCASSLCYESDLLACGQFILCPTRPDGSSPDCTKAPNVVSNTWGGGIGSSAFVDMVQAWRSAGVTVLFSVGSSVPSCGSVGLPADYDTAIAVGSATSDDNLSPFSCAGSTLFGQKFTPDFVAPGSNVLSAHHTSDNAYASLSGNNMACSHAAGTAALALNVNPDLSHDQVKAVLKGGCQAINSDTTTCTGILDTQYVNYHAGSGRINALLSVGQARALLNR